MWQDWRRELNELRSQIDRLDSGIIGLIAKRMQVCRRIGEIKTKRYLPVYMPEREIRVIRNRQNLAKRFSLAEDFISKLFQLVMHESKKIQYGIGHFLSIG